MDEKPTRKEDTPLRKLYEALDRFCARHPYWGIPNLMRYIVIGSIIFYALNLVTAGGAYSLLAYSTAAVLERGEVWRLITFVFLPPSQDPINFALFLYFYYWIGNILEDYWGTPKFNIYYLSGTVLTVLASVLLYALGGGNYYLGTHYVNLAMFLACAVLIPETVIRLFFLIPVKMKWVAWADLVLLAFDILSAIGRRNWGGVMAPVIALLNFAVFFYPYFSRKAQMERRRTSKQAVRFRQTVKASQAPRSYNHRCAVCGKTDTEYPNMSFRYCSRCAGYHCFCEEHIFNHVHFTDE